METHYKTRERKGLPYWAQTLAIYAFLFVCAFAEVRTGKPFGILVICWTAICALGNCIGILCAVFDPLTFREWAKEGAVRPNGWWRTWLLSVWIVTLISIGWKWVAMLTIAYAIPWVILGALAKEAGEEAA